jgi:hypothetical protein
MQERAAPRFDERMKTALLPARHLGRPHQCSPGADGTGYNRIEGCHATVAPCEFGPSQLWRQNRISASTPTPPRSRWWERIDLGTHRRPLGIDVDPKTGNLLMTTELPSTLLMVDRARGRW